MCHTQALYLSRNQICDAGLIAFAKAVESGALDNLTLLRLSANQISDAGLAALAKAITPGPNGKGALASLKTLVVDDEEHPALKAACLARGIDLK